MADTVYQQFCQSARDFGERPFLMLVSDPAERYGMQPGSISYAEAELKINHLAAAYAARDIVPNVFSTGWRSMPWVPPPYRSTLPGKVPNWNMC